MADAGHRYWAFLSYSHQDRPWAAWLHRALEGLAVPRALVGQPTPVGPAPRRMRPIFRDRDELSAGADLGERLVSALRDSAYLIVICSPAAACSSWVGEEVRRFKALHGEERVLAVIVAGEPFAAERPGQAATECFPAALKFHLEADGSIGARPAEPIAADVRPGKDGRRLALLKLLAGMLRTDLDLLVQRDAKRRSQQMLAVTAASLAGSAVLASLAVMALNERDEAVAERAQAEGLIEFMVGDLRKKLEPAGRLDALDAVGARALTYYAAQRRHGLDADSLERRARVLHMLGDIRDRRGDLGEALKLFQEASRTTGDLLDQRPRDPQRIFDHAQSVFWVGDIALERGEDDVARKAFTAYQRLADQLVAIDPKNRDWQAEVGYANTDLGEVLLEDGRADEAAAAFSRGLAISEDLARATPADRERQADLGQSYAWLADAEFLRGRLDAALADRSAEQAIYQSQLQTTPNDNKVSLALAVNLTKVAPIFLSMGRRDEAVTDLTAAIDVFERLMATAPDNAGYKAKATPALLALAQIRLQAGDLDAARPLAHRALDLAEALGRKDRSVTNWRGTRLGAARVLSIKIEAMRARSGPALKAALKPALIEAAQLAALSNARPLRLNVARVAAESALLAGDYRALDSDAAQARAAWAGAKAMLDRVGASGLPSSDRSQVILRQIAYRLRYSRPSDEPLPANFQVIKYRAEAEGPRRIDYTW